MSETNRNRALTIAADLCRHFEGFSSKPYLCPAGYWTIGYGTVYKPDGTVVIKNDIPISKEQANQWLLHELEHNYMAGVLKHTPNVLEHFEILAALTDFAYNLGVARYRASTLSRKIKARDWAAAKVELAKWTRGGGRILPGLVRRRQAEIKLFP